MGSVCIYVHPRSSVKSLNQRGVATGPWQRHLNGLHLKVVDILLGALQCL